MANAIWWIRRDLRLTDNQALAAASAAAEGLIPLFIIDPFLKRSPYAGEKRRAFLWEGLRRLEESLQERGSRLIVRWGKPAAVLAELIEETGATAVYAERDFSPYARRRDDAVAEALPLTLTPGVTVRHPGDVLKDDGDPYVVYTPYRNTWRKRPFPTPAALIPAPEQINTPQNIPSEPIPDEPTLPKSVPFPPGEAEAERRLERFVGERIAAYKKQRDYVDKEGTSQLSPYLRFGVISARRVMVAAREAKAEAESDAARTGVQTWIDELIWREFYVGILYHFPHVMAGSFRPKYDAVPWRDDGEGFEAWCNGRTGYPIVDAAMRQLKQSGWMHNRARMIVASFLVKDLLINWQWGEKWFMQHLVDGDPAANNGGWQWVAGTGTDAAPYFRIFNPTTQGEKYDPDGDYIRRWVPELRGVPDNYIHQPAEMPDDVQRESNCVIGDHYPAPIVNHKEARQRTLEAYKQV